MARKFAGGRLVIASHNHGKIVEIGALLAPYRIAAVGAAALGLPEPEETEATFEGNAALKAHAATQATGLPVLADDSGLVGTPGFGWGAGHLFGALGWAGVRDFALAMARVNDALGGKERRASFVSVLALSWPDGHDELFRGEVHGTLIWPPRGDNGFGYDPMFICGKGTLETFGRAAAYSEVLLLDHRALAFRKLVAACFE